MLERMTANVMKIGSDRNVVIRLSVSGSHFIILKFALEMESV